MSTLEESTQKFPRDTTGLPAATTTGWSSSVTATATRCASRP